MAVDVSFDAGGSHDDEFGCRGGGWTGDAACGTFEFSVERESSHAACAFSVWRAVAATVSDVAFLAVSQRVDILCRSACLVLNAKSIDNSESGNTLDTLSIAV